jgi:two-component system OmpR family response regulator
MEPFRVLVVDDEEDFLETLVNRLKRRQVDTVGVDSGAAALDLLGREEFDVVILDVMMPAMDGIETLKRIKDLRPFTEVIMLTGHGSVESGIQGMRHGAFDYIMKPAEIDDLLVKIREAYERIRLHKERG